MVAALVERGETWQALGERHYAIRPGHPGDMARLLETVLTDNAEVHQVVHLWSLDGPRETNLTAIQEAQALGWENVLDLLQQLVARGPWPNAPRLWLITRGAQPVKPGPLAVGQAPLWGLGRTIALEHAEFWGGLIDLDPQDAPTLCADQLLEEIRGPDENQVAWRDGLRYVARLVRQHIPTQRSSAFACRADASYLITGGLGDLGLSVARWMVQQGRAADSDESQSPAARRLDARGPPKPAGAADRRAAWWRRLGPAFIWRQSTWPTKDRCDSSWISIAGNSGRPFAAWSTRPAS